MYKECPKRGHGTLSLSCAHVKKTLRAHTHTRVYESMYAYVCVCVYIIHI